MAYLSAASRELNRKADGTKKININNGILTDLYDELVEVFDEETAKYIIGYRISGPKDPRPEETSTGVQGSSTQQQKKKTEEELQLGLTKAIAGALGSGGKVTRGGIDLSKGGPNKVKSLWDLIGQRTDVAVDGTTTTLTSPWAGEPSIPRETLAKIMDSLTTTDDEYILGRININQARREILVGLPGMTPELVEKIIAAQKLDANGQPDPAVIAAHSTTGWLFTEGLIEDIWTMRDLDPYFTARGDVYRAQVLGFFDGGGPVSRVEVLVDGTLIPPQITFQRDLNDLGNGYSRLQLFPAAR